MRKRVATIHIVFMCLFCLFFPLSTMAQPIVASYDDINTSPGPEPRNYTRIFTNENGDPIFRVSYAYVGKEPVGEFERFHGWYTIRTDFYNVSQKNLTDKPIELIRSKSYPKIAKGNYTQYRRLPDGEVVGEEQDSTVLKDFKRQPSRYGNVFAPYEERKIDNVFYYYRSSKKNNIPMDNVQYVETIVKYEGREYMLKTYKVFRTEP
ncbi:MAG: hypothetical protein JRJ47_00510 [Deltaproteobacteria bacterium]|nr:hypothetical protein [Deltaproteobacteria bacterium]